MKVLNRELIKEEIGYEIKTTFYEDFSIADELGGEPSIRDTYDRAFKEWHTNLEFITELCMILNWKIWEHYESKNLEIAKVYNELWEKCRDWCFNNLKGSDLNYFIRTTD